MIIAKNTASYPTTRSAYREGYSCETAVLRLLNDALWSMERQEVTPCLLLDLSAAFDTVDHDLFLSIMKERFNIQGRALQWFEQYLRPRSFKVKIDSATSTDKSLQFSVPQGSAAGQTCSLPTVNPCRPVLKQVWN